MAAALAAAVFIAAQPALADDGTSDGASDTGTTAEAVMDETKTVDLAVDTETKVNFGTEPDKKAYYYFRIKPAKTGYITLTGNKISGYIDLCGSDKKVISRKSKSSAGYFSANSSYDYQKVLCFGVKAGKTYYLRIGSCYPRLDSATGNNYGTLKWTNSAVTMKYGKKKSKAVKLKKGKIRKGVIPAGTTKAQWYKITTKKKKVRVTLSSKNVSGKLYARVYYKSAGKWLSTRMHVSRGGKESSVCKLKKTGKKKVTYYVKVYPYYKNSGFYTLTWK